MTDADLIERFRAGDTDAFNALVRRWHGTIYNFVLRYAGDRDDAKDVTQRAFISAYRGLKKLDDPARFAPWLYRIALNGCRDAARASGRHQTVSIEDGPEGVAIPVDPANHPDALAHAVHVREMLNRALQSIPEEQRVVVVMKEYQGLKFREIADALDVPLNTVKARMYYGLDALRKVFDAWRVTEEMMRYEP